MSQLYGSGVEVSAQVGFVKAVSRKGWCTNCDIDVLIRRVASYNRVTDLHPIDSVID
jgi:hypothetical protein